MMTEIPQQRLNDRRHCHNYSQFNHSVGACSNRSIHLHYIDQPVLKQDWQMNHGNFHMEMKVKEDKTIKCVNDQSFFFLQEWPSCNAVKKSWPVKWLEYSFVWKCIIILYVYKRGQWNLIFFPFLGWRKAFSVYFYSILPFPWLTSTVHVQLREFEYSSGYPGDKMIPLGPLISPPHDAE